MLISRITAVATLLLSACATTQAPDQPVVKVQSPVVIDVASRPLETATHNDLLAAAAYAEAHGYPARAAVWRAHDAHLTAIENQISACLNAIKANAPQAIGAVTPFLAVEMAAEAVGQGVPAVVRLNCQALPVPVLPALPKP